MGLLDSYFPECRYGHGHMDLVAGRQSSMFALIEVGLLGMVNPAFGMAVRVFRCKTCNYIELRDIPQSEFNQTIQAGHGTNTN